MRTGWWLGIVVAALAPSARGGEAVPRVYVMAMPAQEVFVAFLPVAGSADAFDLDLRSDVVLPMGCGDTVAGLLRRDGPRLDGADAYDVLIERHPLGDCKKDPTRVTARWAIRIKIADGQTRELTVGALQRKVARKGGEITLDGEAPHGDVPGAPPTAAPASFVAGEVKSVKLLSQRRLDGAMAAVSFEIAARWPKCAGPALGLLGHGDLASKFVLDRFTPVAIAPLDGSCGKATVERKETIEATLRLPPGAPVTISVGAQKVAIAPLPAKK